MVHFFIPSVLPALAQLRVVQIPPARSHPAPPRPAGAYLRKALTLHVGLDPLQPVRVLLLSHPLVHLGTQFFCLLQGMLQVAVVGVVFRGVF